MCLTVTTLKNQIFRVDIKNNMRKTVMRVYFLNLGCTWDLPLWEPMKMKTIRKLVVEQSEANCIYLHVTARLQLMNCFQRRTSHELNFNTRFQLLSSLHAVKYDFNILVNSQMQCSHVIQTQHKSVMECTLILMSFTKETASLYAKPAKHTRSSLTSETRHFDALTHNLYFCAYSGLQNTLIIH